MMTPTDFMHVLTETLEPPQTKLQIAPQESMHLKRCWPATRLHSADNTEI